MATQASQDAYDTDPAAPRRLDRLFVLDQVEVVSSQWLSPTFVRLELGGDCLAEFGVDGPSYDQRIKLVVPGESGRLPVIDGADESWYTTWLDIPAEERGHMRTYTVREVRGSGTDTRVVVDIAVHGDPPTGPGAAWAAAARPGDRCVIVGPRRGVGFGGIEFGPGDAETLLLVADETGVPAVAAILEQLAEVDPDAHGVAFLEVPVCDDVQLLRAPDGVDVRWLVRKGSPWGAKAIPAVRRHVGLTEQPGDPADQVTPLPPDEVDVWETPAYSASGEEIGETLPHHLRCYAWIAGESTVVRTLRRALVSELGWERAQVAFMGYWREGVSMRS
ncbi:siderophore-interacting protein [Marmoricola endophyticus]|uniref:Siderophore-interacting protein n=1 Tax=Marmoricola endophyticus TaxID=2040280 RepID=A0A917BGV5_9ACTN|nr:siderophore-interacting protein [Marmoricola endophyticus]GGF40505.1 siderophore-interacting protein [Marmoricola endophyticus]